MIKQVSSISFEKELMAQNSKPMVFLCDDFERYYCKFTLAEINHDYLVYEIIGSFLANHFAICTPEIAMVTFDPDSLSSGFLQSNYNLQSGNVMFGSQHIGRYDTIDKTNRIDIKNAKVFRRFSNPMDIIKIAVFDVHLNNSDRNSENYNLLIQTEEMKFYAIDHSAIFGGPALKNKFSPQGTPALGQKLVESFLLKNVLKYISFEKVREEILRYHSLCNNELADLIHTIFNSLPESWEISTGLEERVLSYLLDETRNKLINVQLVDRFYQMRKKL